MPNPDRPKIMLIMDDDADESQVTHILTKYRFANHVLRMRRAREAIRYFGSGEALPELIIYSRGETGAAAPAVAALKAEIGATPLIFVAATREEEDGVRALNLPETYCMGRPLGFFKLLEAMQKLGIYWMVLRTPP